MEAANRGAHGAGGKSAGCGIVIPNERGFNRYLTHSMRMKYFFTRKYMLISYSLGFIFLPGGAGTLDELFEVITLIKTNKIPHRPVVLVGREYWGGMMRWLQETVVQEGALDRSSLDLFTIVDRFEEAPASLQQAKPEDQEKSQSHPVNREYGE
jgi:uncharacterized protein (TIGR00730 family)